MCACVCLFVRVRGLVGCLVGCLIVCLLDWVFGCLRGCLRDCLFGCSGVFVRLCVFCLCALLVCVRVCFFLRDCLRA